jgi:biotin transport system substrate-specific component
VFLALVALGLPLLAGGHGGLGVFVGPTAGYLVGWVAGAFVVGLIVHGRRGNPTALRTVVGVLVGGILVIYAFGIPVQAAVLRLELGQVARNEHETLQGDLVKAAIAVAIVLTLARAYPRAFRSRERQRRDQDPREPQQERA